MEDEILNTFNRLLSKSAVYHKLKPKYGRALTHKKINEVIDKTDVVQLTWQSNNTPKYPIFDTREPSYQADLTFLKNRTERGVIGFFTAVEVTSRHAFVRSFTNKRASTMAGIMSEFINETGCRVLSTDNGSEFLNKQVQRVLDKAKVKHITGEPNNKNRMGIVERFNRTLKRRIQQLQIAGKSKRFIDVLQDIVDAYNDTPHTGLQAAYPLKVKTPNETKNHEGAKFLIRADAWLRYQDAVAKTPSIEIGTLVRKRLKPDNKFAKEGEKFSREVYKVVGTQATRATLDDGSVMQMRDLFRTSHKQDTQREHQHTSARSKKLVRSREGLNMANITRASRRKRTR